MWWNLWDNTVKKDVVASSWSNLHADLVESVSQYSRGKSSCSSWSNLHADLVESVSQYSRGRSIVEVEVIFMLIQKNLRHY